MEYSLTQVNQHNSEADCWMVIDDQVYDLGSYLEDHLRFLNIADWCGTDASEDYHSKAGRNKDHSSQADSMLSDYLIGDLVASTQETVVATSQTTDLSQSVSKSSGYNVWLPLFLTMLAYLLSNKFFTKSRHNFIWNTVLFLGLLPSFILGVLMALNLVSKEYLFFHVELSIVFGAACVMHLLFRLRVYLSQVKMGLKKKRELI